MTETFADNPYRLTQEKIIPPPPSFLERLKFLGPGFILSASIVGSGELISTTYLGAEAGFVTLWVIIISCLAKVTIQMEFGKHAIYSGLSTMAALNQLPGPRLGKANWAIWLWLVLMSIKHLQMGGIVGATALILLIVLPGVPLEVYCLLLAVSVALIVYQAKYRPIERLALIFIGLFTVLTIASVIVLQFTPLKISSEELLSGLQFQLPAYAVVAAVGAFGITGVGGDEIMAYNYWLIEKGYAAYTGPRDHSDLWKIRARGWINVMYLDAFLAMVVYTVMTVAFYLLGAAVLHRQNLKPKGHELIETLSNMYTQSLGPWAKMIFLIGAFVVLYSTLFGALAIWTRLFSDAFSQIGWLDFSDTRQRKRMIALLAWSFPLLWAVLFFIVDAPVLMVVIGGITTAAILLIVVFAVLHFRYRQLPKELTPGWGYMIAFWISVISILLVAIYSIYTMLK